MSFTAGSRPAWLIRTPSTSSPSSEVSWHCYAKELGKPLVRLRLRRQVLQLPVQPPHRSKGHWWTIRTSPALRPRQSLSHPASLTAHPQSIRGSLSICPRPWQYGPSTNGSRTYHCLNKEWRSNQPAEAIETVERVAVMMGIPVSLLGKNYDALNLLKVMTAAVSMTNWLAPQFRRKLKHKVLQSHLAILNSMILILYLLSPFTMTHSIHLFQGFRIIQTRMMVLAVIHGLRPNQKLKSILEGCTDL